MKTYAGWQAVYLSFFSADFYRYVAKNWKGVGYQYLFLLVAIFAAVNAIVIQVMASTMLSPENVNPTLDKWPGVTVDGGKLSIDRASPYVVDFGGSIIDFDTTSDAKFPAGKQGLLVTNSSVHTVGPSGDNSIIELSQYSTFPKMVLDKAMLLSIINLFKTWVGIVIFVFTDLGLLLVCMFQTVFYALAGMIAAKAMNVDLSYSQLVRLTSVALTPVLILDAIITRLHPFPGWGFLTIFIAIGFLIFGVYANKAQSQSTPVV